MARIQGGSIRKNKISFSSSWPSPSVSVNVAFGAVLSNPPASPSPSTSATYSDTTEKSCNIVCSLSKNNLVSLFSELSRKNRLLAEIDAIIRKLEEETI